ncbi:MAG: U32 family peptidase [Thermacetogeniaceae bacterium]
MSTNVHSARIELLAPVGKWSVLEAVIAAGADAVYLGGKKYNMRLHRKDFNFTDEELRSAVEYAHERKVKLYVTVNNLLTNAETDDLPDYLRHLEEITADGIIVQDLGVAQLVRELGLRIPLHASVMMNAHNLEGLLLLKELGISRAILGREVTLADIKLWHSQTDLELEYFTHGDMCFSQSSQCYLSGMLFGESSNRGRCLKPCRWPLELVDRETGAVLAPDPGRPGIPPTAGPYFLAVKDICLLPFLPEVIDAGVCSLKIEGRMREAGFLADLIGFYRRALDRYYADPFGYQFDWDEFRELEQKRVRDMSPLYAFGNPGPSSVGYTGEREPRFFSSPVREPEITAADLPVNPLPGPEPWPHEEVRPLLAVKAGSLEAALAALEQGADLIYTSGESFLSQPQPWHLGDFAELLVAAHDQGCRAVIGTPRIVMSAEMGRVHQLLSAIRQLQPPPDGVLVTNLGTIYAARSTGLPLYADYSCNIANGRATALLQSAGAVQATVPLEFRAEEILAMPSQAALPLEAVIHGQLPAMVSDHCLPAALLDGATRFQICSGACRQHRFGLRDTAGMVHPLEIDTSCRNHLFMAHELALLPYLRSFYGAGFHSLRLEIPGYSAAEAGAVTGLYREQIDRLWSDPETYAFKTADWEQLLQARCAAFGTGPYTRGVRVKE